MLAQPLPTLSQSIYGRRRLNAAGIATPRYPSGNIVAAAAAMAHLTWATLPAHAWPLSRPAKFLYLDATPNGMGIAVRLESAPGSTRPIPSRFRTPYWTSQTAVSLAHNGRDPVA